MGWNDHTNLLELQKKLECIPSRQDGPTLTFLFNGNHPYTFQLPLTISGEKKASKLFLLRKKNAHRTITFKVFCIIFRLIKYAIASIIKKILGLKLTILRHTI